MRVGMNGFGRIGRLVLGAATPCPALPGPVPRPRVATA